MAEEKYNRKNPAVKRILQELKEMQANPSDDFMSLPLEENIFEWQFAIRGPKDTEFEGGIFHGRIQLPSEYPFKPPSFLLLTPNGRFETQTKICLSISNYHPEHWQPSWSVRTALVALIAFMPTSPNGALGSLEYTKEERRVLAIKSREAAPIFGNPDRQQLINEIHEYMLSKSPSLPRENSSDESAVQVIEAERTTEIVDANDTEQNLPDSDSTSTIVEEHQNELSPPITNPVQMSSPDATTTTVQTSPPAVQPSVQQLPRRTEAPPRHADDRLFTMAAVGLTIAIVVLLLKKFMRANGYGAMFTDES